MNTDLINRYEELDLKIRQLREEAKIYCRNKDIPLNDRWDVFTLTGCGDSKDCVESWIYFDEKNNSNFESYFNSEYRRGSTVDLITLIGYLESDIVSGNPFEEWVTQEVIDSLKDYLIDIWLAEYIFQG